MSNALTAKAALMVIATGISVGTPTNANEQRPPSEVICAQLTKDADSTCQLLADGVGLAHPKGGPDAERARVAAKRLCKVWTTVAMADCLRLRALSEQ